MRVRALLLAGAAIATSLTAIAEAAPAPKKACNLVVDPAGDIDNTLVAGPVFPASDNMDIVGGDIASTSKSITAAIKLKAFNAIDPATIYGRRYTFDFKPAGSKNTLLLTVLMTPAETTYRFGYYSINETTGAQTTNSPGPATGRIEGNTIYITASLADMAGVPEVGKISKGSKITGIRAVANRRLGTFLFQADEAVGKTPYYAEQPSCMKVG